MMANCFAMVTGATNQIGFFLLPRLQAAGFSVTAVSRKGLKGDSSVRWLSVDLLTTPLMIEEPVWLFHLAPLPLLPILLARLSVSDGFKSRYLQKVIAFSSTSCFTKANSPDPKERAVAVELSVAEREVIAWCEAHQVAWVLLRPTLIYGCGRDENVSFIAGFIRRFGFFPILGAGSGLRQPVHADDLALACLQVAFSNLAVNRAYNLSGGETLSYREMVAAIFAQLGKPVRIFSLPPRLYQALALNWWLPLISSVSPAMIMRMNQDLCFEHEAATRDFGYLPRNFCDNEMGFDG
jgi:nucleoside-diphosphate-sugar epimerase